MERRCPLECGPRRAGLGGPCSSLCWSLHACLGGCHVTHARWLLRNMQAVDEDERLLAVACRGSELALWDLARQRRTYLAKGAKPNRVGLTDLPWCTAVAFVPGSSGTKVGILILSDNETIEVNS